MIKKYIVRVTILYILVVTILSLVKMSSLPKPPTVTNFDKLVHFGFYFVMNMLVLIGARYRFGVSKVMPVIYITLGVISYGALIDVVQHFIGRECSLYDIAANSVGAVTALVVFRIHQDRHPEMR